MKKNKIAILALVAVITTSLLPGCATKGKPAAKATKLAHVTLKIVQPGDKGTTFDATLAKLETMNPDLNTSVDVTFVPWSDLATKTQLMLASGDNIDLIYDAPWIHMNQMITAGTYEDLGPLLAKYGKDIISSRPKQMWDANKFDGKIMGVPLGLYMQQPHDYVIRKDLREKLGIAPIKTYEDLINYAYAVKKAYPSMYPLAPGANNPQNTWVAWKMLDDSATNIRFTQALGSSLMLYYKNNDGKVHNLFDEMDPKISEALTETRKFYTDKLINPDILASAKDPSPFYLSGKSAVATQRLFTATGDAKMLKSLKDLGGEAEAVTLMTKEPGKVISSFTMDNFVCLTKTSKNKERAIQWLDAMNKTDNYLTLEHGVKGTDWDTVGTNKWTNKTGNEFAWQAYAINWNPTNELVPDYADQNAVDRFKLIANGDYFIKDITSGFTFNSDPVKNELAQYTAIEGKYYLAIMNGVVDPTAYLGKFKAEAGPLLKKVQDELQKQVNAYIKK